MMGVLQYLTITYVDLTHDANFVSQYMQSLILHHFQALQRILRYAKSTFQHGLYFSSSPPTSLTAYSDVGWASCLDTRHFTSGYAIFLGDNLIS
jgi:hypothetical protein